MTSSHGKEGDPADSGFGGLVQKLLDSSDNEQNAKGTQAGQQVGKKSSSKGKSVGKSSNDEQSGDDQLLKSTGMSQGTIEMSPAYVSIPTIAIPQQALSHPEPLPQVPSRTEVSVGVDATSAEQAPARQYAGPVEGSARRVTLSTDQPSVTPDVASAHATEPSSEWRTMVSRMAAGSTGVSVNDSAETLDLSVQAWSGGQPMSTQQTSGSAQSHDFDESTIVSSGAVGSDARPEIVQTAPQSSSRPIASDIPMSAGSKMDAVSTEVVVADAPELSETVTIADRPTSARSLETLTGQATVDTDTAPTVDMSGPATSTDAVEPSVSHISVPADEAEPVIDALRSLLVNQAYSRNAEQSIEPADPRAETIAVPVAVPVTAAPLDRPIIEAQAQVVASSSTVDELPEPAAVSASEYAPAQADAAADLVPADTVDVPGNARTAAPVTSDATQPSEALTVAPDSRPTVSTAGAQTPAPVEAAAADPATPESPDLPSSSIMPAQPRRLFAASDEPAVSSGDAPLTGVVSPAQPSPEAEVVLGPSIEESSDEVIAPSITLTPAGTPTTERTTQTGVQSETAPSPTNTTTQRIDTQSVVPALSPNRMETSEAPVPALAEAAPVVGSTEPATPAIAQDAVTEHSISTAASGIDQSPVISAPTLRATEATEVVVAPSEPSRAVASVVTSAPAAIQDVVTETTVETASRPATPSVVSAPITSPTEAPDAPAASNVEADQTVARGEIIPTSNRAAASHPSASPATSTPISATSEPVVSGADLTASTTAPASTVAGGDTGTSAQAPSADTPSVMPTPMRRLMTEAQDSGSTPADLNVAESTVAAPQTRVSVTAETDSRAESAPIAYASVVSTQSPVAGVDPAEDAPVNVLPTTATDVEPVAVSTAQAADIVRAATPQTRQADEVVADGPAPVIPSAAASVAPLAANAAVQPTVRTQSAPEITPATRTVDAAASASSNAPTIAAQSTSTSVEAPAQYESAMTQPTAQTPPTSAASPAVASAVRVAQARAYMPQGVEAMTQVAREMEPQIVAHYAPARPLADAQPQTQATASDAAVVAESVVSSAAKSPVEAQIPVSKPQANAVETVDAVPASVASVHPSANAYVPSAATETAAATLEGDEVVPAAPVTVESRERPAETVQNHRSQDAPQTRVEAESAPAMSTTVVEPASQSLDGVEKPVLTAEPAAEDRSERPVVATMRPEASLPKTAESDSQTPSSPSPVAAPTMAVQDEQTQPEQIGAVASGSTSSDPQVVRQQVVTTAEPVAEGSSKQPAVTFDEPQITVTRQSEAPVVSTVEPQAVATRQSDASSAPVAELSVQTGQPAKTEPIRAEVSTVTAEVKDAQPEQTGAVSSGTMDLDPQTPPTTPVQRQVAVAAEPVMENAPDEAAVTFIEPRAMVTEQSEAMTVRPQSLSDQPVQSTPAMAEAPRATVDGEQTQQEWVSAASSVVVSSDPQVVRRQAVVTAEPAAEGARVQPTVTFDEPQATVTSQADSVSAPVVERNAQADQPAKTESIRAEIPTTALDSDSRNAALDGVQRRVVAATEPVVDSVTDQPTASAVQPQAQADQSVASLSEPRATVTEQSGVSSAPTVEHSAQADQPVKAEPVRAESPMMTADAEEAQPEQIGVVSSGVVDPDPQIASMDGTRRQTVVAAKPVAEGVVEEPVASLNESRAAVTRQPEASPASTPEPQAHVDQPIQNKPAPTEAPALTVEDEQMRLKQSAVSFDERRVTVAAQITPTPESVVESAPIQAAVSSDEAPVMTIAQPETPAATTLEPQAQPDQPVQNRPIPAEIPAITVEGEQAQPEQISVVSTGAVESDQQTAPAVGVQRQAVAVAEPVAEGIPDQVAVSFSEPRATVAAQPETPTVPTVKPQAQVDQPVVPSNEPRAEVTRQPDASPASTPEPQAQVDQPVQNKPVPAEREQARPEQIGVVSTGTVESDQQTAPAAGVQRQVVAVAEPVAEEAPDQVAVSFSEPRATVAAQSETPTVPTVKPQAQVGQPMQSKPVPAETPTMTAEDGQAQSEQSAVSFDERRVTVATQPDASTVKTVEPQAQADPPVQSEAAREVVEPTIAAVDSADQSGAMDVTDAVSPRAQQTPVHQTTEPAVAGEPAPVAQADDPVAQFEPTKAVALVDEGVAATELGEEPSRAVAAAVPSSAQPVQQAVARPEVEVSSVQEQPARPETPQIVASASRVEAAAEALPMVSAQPAEPVIPIVGVADGMDEVAPVTADGPSFEAVIDPAPAQAPDTITPASDPKVEVPSVELPIVSVGVSAAGTKSESTPSVLDRPVEATESVHTIERAISELSMGHAVVVETSAQASAERKSGNAEAPSPRRASAKAARSRVAASDTSTNRAGDAVRSDVGTASSATGTPRAEQTDSAVEPIAQARGSRAAVEASAQVSERKAEPRVAAEAEAPRKTSSKQALESTSLPEAALPAVGETPQPTQVSATPEPSPESASAFVTAAESAREDGAMKVSEADDHVNAMAGPDIATMSPRPQAARDSRASASVAERMAGPDLDPTVTSKVIGQVVRSARMSLSDSGGNITMQLEPAHLGAVRMSVTVHQGVVTASVETSSMAAKQILESDLPTLRKSLSDAGIVVDSVRVSVDTGGSGGSTAQNQAQRDRQQPEPYRTLSYGHGREDEASVATVQPTQSLTPIGQLNYLV